MIQYDDMIWYQIMYRDDANDIHPHLQTFSESEVTIDIANEDMQLIDKHK